MLTGLSLAAGLLGGCRAGCEVTAAAIEPEAGLDDEVDYLASLRRAAEANDATAHAQWQRDQHDYEELKPVRLAELREHPYLLQFPQWSDDQRLGWDAWFHWTAGNQLTWRDLAQRSGGKLNLLKILDNNLLDRGERFAKYGLLNDPDATPPERDAAGGCKVDAYGLCLDRIATRRESPATERWLGRPSGILGMRLFDNPDYRPGAWNAADPWQPTPGCNPGVRQGRDPAATARQSREDCYQPPYLVGLSCGFCHISFNPENPPADPARPAWENLAGLLGNVYFKEGPLFAWLLDFGKDAFYTDYLMLQPPGTSDTSRIATDDLDNPGAINALFQVSARLAAAADERMPNGRVQPVPHILKDGADSVGLPLAALRVYVNIGMLGNYWLNQHDAYLLLGGAPRPQEPFRVERAMRTPGYDGTYWWNQTELRMPDVAAFFTTPAPFKLAASPGGATYLTAGDAVLRRGRLAFADHCAGCHSSKQPAVDRERDPAAWREQMREILLRPDFLEGNLLSDDRRYPAPVVGVNLTRSLATNALQGQIWQDFSSLTYKSLPPLGEVELPDPFAPEKNRKLCAPSGGRGYYRTASLVSLWATAPFFHNNSLGRPLQDASVAGRVQAFTDAAEQFLWLERRTDPQGAVGPYVKRTGDRVTWLPLPDGLLVPLPPRYPVKVLGNLPLHDLSERLPARLAKALFGGRGGTAAARKERIVREVLGDEILRRELRKLLLDLNAAPDFVENKGHERFVASLDDEDKRALIEFMKTF
jgi:mono/diheme cytochrome c family protein